MLHTALQVLSTQECALGRLSWVTGLSWWDRAYHKEVRPGDVYVDQVEHLDLPDERRLRELRHIAHHSLVPTADSDTPFGAARSSRPRGAPLSFYFRIPGAPRGRGRVTV
eukprot:4981951-Prymnesium_polylepis.1